MARTYRRGKQTRNLKDYIKRGVLYHENRTCHFRGCPSLNGLPFWMDDWNDPRTYDQYVTEKLRFYHSEAGYWRGLPRHVRDIDLSKQTRVHKHAIHKAIRSGDYDVVLERMDKAAVWMWE